MKRRDFRNGFRSPFVSDQKTYSFGVNLFIAPSRLDFGIVKVVMDVSFRNIYLGQDLITNFCATEANTILTKSAARRV
jgi:hypothetical protein